jgi:hypothetical protein
MSLAFEVEHEIEETASMQGGGVMNNEIDESNMRVDSHRTEY